MPPALLLPFIPTVTLPDLLPAFPVLSFVIACLALVAAAPAAALPFLRAAAIVAKVLLNLSLSTTGGTAVTNDGVVDPLAALSDVLKAVLALGSAPSMTPPVAEAAVRPTSSDGGSDTVGILVVLHEEEEKEGLLALAAVAVAVLVAEEVIGAAPRLLT